MLLTRRKYVLRGECQTSGGDRFGSLGGTWRGSFGTLGGFGGRCLARGRGLSQWRLKFGPQSAQMAPKGPKWKFKGATWETRSGHLGLSGPPKVRSKKKMRSSWAPLGSRCGFYLGKNENRQNGPLGPQGALGGAFGPPGGPSGPF